MSVKDAIGILITRGNAKNIFEYRVAYVPEISGITTNPDYPTMDNPAYSRAFALQAFGECRIIFNYEEAQRKAEQLKIKNKLTEVGIIQLHYTNTNFPADRRRQNKMIGRMSKIIRVTE